jgi:hypothetical protein
MRKKATILATAVIIIVVVFFFEFCVFRTLQQTTPIYAILNDPSAWVNQTVVVEGRIIAGWEQTSGFSQPPFTFGLTSNGNTIGVFWLGAIYNGNAIVHGIVTEGQWAILTTNGTVFYGPNVYYIVAQTVQEPL